MLTYGMHYAGLSWPCGSSISSLYPRISPGGFWFPSLSNIYGSARWMWIIKINFQWFGYNQNLIWVEAAIQHLCANLVKGKKHHELVKQHYHLWNRLVMKFLLTKRNTSSFSLGQTKIVIWSIWCQNILVTTRLVICYILGQSPWNYKITIITKRLYMNEIIYECVPLVWPCEGAIWVV